LLAKHLGLELGSLHCYLPVEVSDFKYSPPPKLKKGFKIDQIDSGSTILKIVTVAIGSGGCFGSEFGYVINYGRVRQQRFE